MKGITCFSLVILLTIPLASAHAQEKIFVPVNKSWKLAHPDKKFFGVTDKNVTVFIPKDEKINSWSRRITVNQMPDKKISPEVYEANLQGDIEKSGACTKFSTVQPTKTNKTEFTASVITFQCLQKDGRSQIFMSKTMEGQKGIYEVRYSFITDDNGKYNGKKLKDYLGEEVVKFMQQVTLCDNEIKGRACPVVK